MTLRPRLTYANVASTLALFLALTGAGAYAAGQLAPKSVGERQLRPGAVTAEKLRKNAVTAPKIKSLAVKQGKLANGAIVASKLAGNSVTEAKIAAGAVTAEKIPGDSLTGAKIQESTLSQVPSANTANFASSAETANPEAFAKVDAEGAAYPAYSKGIGTADVRQGPEPGSYCVRAPGFGPRGGQVSPEYFSDKQVSVFLKLSTSNCPYPQVEVRTYNAGSLQKEPFFIVLYR